MGSEPDKRGLVSRMVVHEPRMAALGWIPYLGQSDSLVSKRILGRYPVKIQEIAEDALDAFEQALIETGYENPCDWTGSYNKRIIKGSSPEMWSTHAYGTAIDLDYGGGVDEPFIDRNPYIRRRIQLEDFGVECQILEHQVRAVEQIKNLDGRKMWRWLGWSIGDTMHFQLDVSPNQTQVDWSTVPGYVLPPDGEDGALDEYYQKIFDEWSYAEVEQMEARGWWEGETVYFKGPGASPNFEDVKNLVRKCLANGIAAQSYVYSAADVSELEDTVALLSASLDDTQEKLRSV